MLNTIRPAVSIFVILTLITGVIYPAVVTAIAKTVFADAASGSIIERDGKAVGSSLIAQPFTDAKYFWPRPSAANYDAAASSGSNLGPSNPALVEAVAARVANLRAADPDNRAAVPVDLVSASGSGLDPHISVAAAEYQVARVARVRRLSVDDVRRIVQRHTEGGGGLFGTEAHVNVLELNLELDGPVTKTVTHLDTPLSRWPMSTR